MNVKWLRHRLIVLTCDNRRKWSDQTEDCVDCLQMDRPATSPPLPQVGPHRGVCLPHGVWADLDDESTDRFFGNIDTGLLQPALCRWQRPRDPGEHHISSPREWPHLHTNPIALWKSPVLRFRRGSEVWMKASTRYRPTAYLECNWYMEVGLHGRTGGQSATKHCAFSVDVSPRIQPP